jgi:hypothetical protein
VIVLHALEIAKAQLTSDADVAADASAEASADDVDRDDAAEPGPKGQQPWPAEAIRSDSTRWQFDRALIDRFAARYDGGAVAVGSDPTERSDPSPEASARRHAPRSADAVVRLASNFLDGVRASAPEGRRERYALVLHASAEALCRDDDDAAAGVVTSDGVRLHPETARRLSCDCPTSTVIVDDAGSALHLGRRTRRIRGRLARAVRWRDGGRCQAPGCGSAATMIHHIRHWARGGSTCLLNLISLCDVHHWLVHEGGWNLAVKRPGVWRFYAPDGTRLDTDHTTAAASRPLPTETAVASDAVTGRWDGDSVDVRYAVAVLNSSSLA